MERELIEAYRASILGLAKRLSADNLALAVELANLPEQIRGFGHVKDAAVHKVRARWRQIEQALDAGSGPVAAHKKAA